MELVAPGPGGSSIGWAVTHVGNLVGGRAGLVGYEVLNALRYSGSFGAEEMIEVSRALEGYRFFEVGMSGRCSGEAVKVAMDYGVTVRRRLPIDREAEGA